MKTQILAKRIVTVIVASLSILLVGNLSQSYAGSLPPVADAGLDQLVNEGTLVKLDGTESYDPDGEIVAYYWEQLSGPPLSHPGNLSSCEP